MTEKYLKLIYLFKYILIYTRVNWESFLYMYTIVPVRFGLHG